MRQHTQIQVQTPVIKQLTWVFEIFDLKGEENVPTARHSINPVPNESAVQGATTRLASCVPKARDRYAKGGCLHN